MGSNKSDLFPVRVGLLRPDFFHISGFSNLPHAKYYFFFLCLVYAVTVLGNSLVTFIIYIDRSLHTPKYMAVFSLAIADLGESTAIFPNVVQNIIFNIHEITYGACLANMFFVYFFNSVQSVMLTVLAYDRFVAICFPLRYHSIVTNKSMGIIVTVGWIFNCTYMIVGIIFIIKLSFCKSTVIDSYFCDHGPIYRLACNDNTPSITLVKVYIVLHLFLPMFVISLSYASILLALSKIASWEGRLKALKTCFSHLILVSVFYIPLLGIYIAGIYIPINPSARIINTSLSYGVPAMLNPIVYSLNTAEIKEFVKKMFRRNRHKGIVPTIVK
ncbi:olfactory receptor 1-like [Paramormyrops kingsleyae]|uniref:olfactory receptor 1-like n=1 Tax=Paramormyrops kingsleyae TaxID=1676925 RepID=UPI003B96D8C7